MDTGLDKFAGEFIGAVILLVLVSWGVNGFFDLFDSQATKSIKHCVEVVQPWESYPYFTNDEIRRVKSCAKVGVTDPEVISAIENGGPYKWSKIQDFK